MPGALWSICWNLESKRWLPRIYGLLMLLFSATILNASPLGGLKFQGSEQPIDQRTSYNVFGKKTPEFSGTFSIDFNLSLYPTTEFGYIVRIKNQGSNRIYNLLYDGLGANLTFRFNEEGKSNLIVANISKDELHYMNWFKMRISFNLQGDSITLTIQDRTFSAKNQDLPSVYQPVILFGKSDHIIDVPSFAIKDLAVGNNNQYLFKLNESNGHVVHDVNGKPFGDVSNPEWLINDAYHWRYKVAFKSKSIAGANYSPATKELYYFNSDSLYTYNVRSGIKGIKVFDEKLPVRLKLGTNFIHGSKLYSYEPNIENYDGPTVASLDLNTYKWTAESSTQLVSPLHHHGSYVSHSAEQYTIYGGFGRMRYGKDFFSYDVNKKKWDTLGGFTGDFLSPRYFCSVGYLKKTNAVYVFGGMGNESGEQTVGRKYYYDLYKIDLQMKHISKLWEIQWGGDNMVPVRGMVILDDSAFYTLCYPEHFSQSLLKLYKFSIKDGSYEVLGDSIPIRSDKITTNANLYYDSILNNLYATVQEFDDDISSSLRVYSLSFPPLTVQELANYSQHESNNLLVIILVSVVLVSAVTLLIYKIRSKRRVSDDNGIHTVDTSVGKSEPKTKSNSIYLFGEFTVRDKKNRNITYMFSAQLKQILCLILQYSLTEDDGIASQKLSSILWPDKPADKVKNSRGVTLNHLRKALAELEGIELIYDKGCFKIAMADGLYCDYARCMHIISTNDIENHRIELVEILSRGKFLQLSDHSLYDSFKEEMEKKLEPVLIVEVEKTFASESYQTTIALADALINIDPLNETALTFQISAMQRLKMHDEARLTYQTFVTEYKKVMGTDYPHPYKS